MKKIITLALALLLSIPTFALTLKVGDSFAYLPTKDGKDSVSVVTKIAPAINGTFELTLFANGVSYSYAVTDGAELNLYTKSSPKAKIADAKTITVTSVRNNALEFDSISGGSASASTADAK